MALRAAYRPGGKTEMATLVPSASAPEGVLAFLRSRSEKMPPWAEALASTFPGLGDALNMSNRLVIVLPVMDRKFAICFGYGASTLDDAAVEGNFGLRFAARRLDPYAVNDVRSRRIDATSRTQSVHVPIGSDIRDLDIMLDGEFVSRLVGDLDNNGVSFPDLGAIVATDSVAFKLETDLSRVQQVLEFMLREVAERPVREELLFIDSLEPLRPNHPDVERLEEALIAALVDNPETRVADLSLDQGGDLSQLILEFSPPDSVSSEDVDIIEVHRGQRVEQLSELTFGGLRETLSALGGRFGRASLKNIKLMAIRSDGEPASRMLPLRNWIVFETGTSDRRYILTLGKWFALKEEYTRRLNEDLARIRIVTDELSMGPWEAHLAEGKYLREVAKSDPNFVLMDTVDVRSEEGDEVESCDLLHRDGYLVHAKRYTKSQTLSHLFSQGYVSAQLLARDALYKERFVEAITGRSNHFAEVANDAPRVVTYAIGFTGSKTVPGDLPTFSKVNLRDFAIRLRGSQVEPTLCRIQIIDGQ